MTTSNTITRTDLTNILNEILPVPPHTAQIGQVTAFAGSTAPEGWLMCNGNAVSRTTYAKLFAVIGTTYGTGDGSTTFNLPNLKGRFPLGVGSIDPGDSSAESYWGGATSASVNCPLGQRAGEPKHTLTINELPSNAYYSNYVDAAQWGDYEATGAHYYRTKGGGAAHTNMPPFTALNFIIYAGTDFPPFEPDCAIYVSTADPTSVDGNDGDIWIKYTTSS